MSDILLCADSSTAANNKTVTKKLMKKANTYNAAQKMKFSIKDFFSK